jgi:uncharacterized membrane protein
MPDGDIHVMVSAFQSQEDAKSAFEDLKAKAKTGEIVLDDAALITKDEKGRIHHKETAEWSQGKGAAVGAAVGAALGLLTGPIGLVAVAGGAMGAGATAPDRGFSDVRMRKLGDGLAPGTAAVVAVTGGVDLVGLRNAMDETGGDTMVERMSDDIAAQLAAGGDVSYSGVVRPDGIVMTKDGPEKVED